MRSRKAKSSSVPLIAGAFVMVLALAGAAFLLLGDDAPATPDENGAAVILDDGDEGPLMALPDAPTATQEVERLVAQPSSTSGPPTVTQVTDPEAPTGRIEGVCVDSRGMTVEGVLVRVSAGSPIANMTFSSVREFLAPSTVTGSDGLFVLEDVPIGKNYLLVGEHPDFAPSTLQGVAVRKDETVAGARLVLRSGASVAGLVATKAESPIGAARVEIYDSVADARLKVEQRRPHRIVLTDGAGRFEFKNVAMASYKVRVLADGYETQALTVNSALKAGPEDQDLQFLLGEGRSLNGRVVDQDGKPVKDARIEANALKRDYQGNAIAFSEQNGYFLLDGMGVDHPYQIRCTAHGFSDKTLPSVQVLDGEILFQLDRRLSVEGWVRDGSGAAVPDFALVLMRGIANREAALMNDLREFSDSEGHFVFDNLEPGTWGFEARASGYAPARSELVEVARGVAAPQVDIVVKAGGTLTGVVQRADGTPVKGALVRINENNFVDTPLLAIFNTMSPSVDKPIKRRTNAKGKFVFTNLAPGIYQVSVKHHDAAPLSVNDVQVYDDSERENAPLVLKLPVSASIEGVAYDENRRPLAFTRVQLSMTNGYVESLSTDEFGNFRFDNLTGGDYKLTVYPDRDEGDEPMNPLLKLVHAQQSLKPVRLYDGQQMVGVELYLKGS